MRFQFNSHMKAALLITATSVPSLIHAKQSRPSGLSMAEYNTILFTDINKEFEDSESLWIEATNIEWKRAKNSEAINLLHSQSDELQENHHLRSPKQYSNSSKKGEYSFPYVVCETSSDKSGFQSRNEVEAHFGSNLLVLYNNKDKTCFLTDVLSSVAEGAPSTNMKVQPLLPEMKIAAGVVDKIHEKKSFKFEAVLCPGRVSANKDGAEDRAKSIGLSIIESMRRDSNKDEEIGDTKSSENEATIMMERFLRVEEEWRGQSRDHKMTNREKLWQGAFQNGIHFNHQCDDVFQRMFISSGYKGESFVVGVSEDGGEYSIPYYLSSSECLLSLVASLAVSREVCHVGALGQLETLNAPSQWIIQSKVEDKRPWFDVGLDGSGQVVAVSDTGIDMDNCYFWDSTGNVKRNGNVDDSKRKVIQYVPHIGFNDDKWIGHGTHVAATVAGRKAGDGHTESTGIADGVAREAKIAFIDVGILGTKIFEPNDVNKLFGPGQSAGAKIHSASWGYRDNSYNAQSKSFDQWMYDNPDFLVVVAAGNSGSDPLAQPPVYDIPYTVGAPATAKNIISVGATESWGNELNMPNMMGYEYIAHFSSRGPTLDNRTKPDILAPGYNILSAKSHGRSHEYSCDNDNNGTKYMEGTSMAAPAVSGTAALIRQYFTQGWYPTGKPVPENTMNPSAALVKAVLMNGANFVKGVNNNGTVTPVSPYDNAQNFGRISLVDSLRLEGWTGDDSIDAFVQDKKTIFDGDETNITVTVATSENCTSTKLSVTLVWTDLPAGVPSCARCLMNDLDLTVSKKHPKDVFLTASDEDVIFFPNGLINKDNLNNAERVQFIAENGDQFVVSVAGYNLVTASQEYALAMTGCFEVSE